MMALLVATGPLLAQHEPQHRQSPYVDQEESGIAALSREEVDGLLAGAGMGMARAAELNHFPGPRHVLELATGLGLSSAQEAEVGQIHSRMLAEAKRLGGAIVERERRLDRHFANSQIDATTLRQESAEVGRLRGELRFVHLRAHLETRAVLSTAQVELYDRLRGYEAVVMETSAEMPGSKASSCAKIEGVKRLLGRNRVLVLGELHGTQESPAFVGEVVCQAAASGYSVTVGLELLESEKRGVEAYLASAGGEADRRSLVFGAAWSADYQDGRTSQAIVELLDRLRSFRTAGHKIEVELFDRGGWRSGQERDRLMAEALAEVLETAASDIVVILTGNIHSRVVRGTGWDENYQPMAYLLTSLTTRDLVSLDVAHAGGSAWICNGSTPSSCGVRRIGGGGKESGMSIELGVEPSATGHHGRYQVGTLNASPPAAAEMAAAL
jgi:hypothetical protein